MFPIDLGIGPDILLLEMSLQIHITSQANKNVRTTLAAIMFLDIVLKGNLRRFNHDTRITKTHNLSKFIICPNSTGIVPVILLEDRFL